MRINLSFKDAKITQINECEFKIVFDLSSMNTPRLSPDARMYIEHFNLCEFRDEAYGEKGNLRGYFELRCQNLQNSDWNSEDGNSGNCVLYRSPLTSFNSFTNNDPMLISNFKINQGFLSNSLTMFLKFYDQNGDPYTTSSSLFSEIDENTSEFTAHTTAIQDLDTSLKQREPVIKLLQNKEILLKQQQGKVSNATNILRTAQNNLFNDIENFTKLGTSPIRAKIRVEGFKLLIQAYNINDTIYTFESINYALSGFQTLKNVLKTYYQAFVEHLEETHILDQLTIDIGNLQSNTTAIFEHFDTEFDPTSLLLKPDTQIGVGYEVIVPGGTNKNGTCSITYFNAPSATIPKKVIVVDDIQQTTGTLNKNDILEIDSSIFESIIPQTFTYKFVKDTDASPTGLSFVDTTGTNFSNDRKKALRFSFEVVRSSTSAYTITFTNLVENVNDGFSKGFEDGDVITIDGTIMDGVSPANDLTITIPTVVTYSANTTKSFSTLDDGDSTKGTIDIDIGIDNTGVNDYVLTINDLTSTSNFKVSDEFVIKGSLLDGVDGLLANGGNDCILKVDSVGSAGEILALSFQEGKNRFFDNIGEIERSSTTIAGTGIDITTITVPTGKITLINDAIEKSINTLDAEIITKRANVVATKNALILNNKKYITNISNYQKDKIKAIHMSMVLYDEIPEYTQASYDAISGNTYSRVMNCQFKRI